MEAGRFWPKWSDQENCQTVSGEFPLLAMPSKEFAFVANFDDSNLHRFFALVADLEDLQAAIDEEAFLNVGFDIDLREALRAQQCALFVPSSPQIQAEPKKLQHLLGPQISARLSLRVIHHPHHQPSLSRPRWQASSLACKPLRSPSRSRATPKACPKKR